MMSSHQRVTLTILGLLCTFFYSTANAQTCTEQFPEATQGSIQALPGVKIYVGGFNVTDINKGPYKLTGGVCIENPEGVQFISVEADVTIVNDSATIEAKDVSVTFEGYELTAKTLLSQGDDLQLGDVVFEGANLEGVAQKAIFNFATQELELLESSVRGESVTIESKRAKLVGDQATFEELTATTCRCSSDPFYQVRAERANFDLTTQTLVVTSGTLELTGLRLAFNEVTVSPETLRDFRFPVEIAYVGGSVADGATGLGIKIPSLRLAEGLTLELGLVGLDDAYPFAGIFVIHYQDEKTKADIGFTPFGLQADFSVTEPLTPWLGVTFGINNRHWAKADFLHESYVSLNAQTSMAVFANDSLSVNGQVFVAGSSQTFASDQTIAGEPVLDGRLGLYSETNYQAPALSFGQFGLGTQTRLSYYPAANKVQWGVRLNPRWQHTIGAVRFDVSYSRQWTNSNSPFSTTLDKLEPEHKLIASSTVAGPLLNNLQGKLNFAATYNFLDVTRYVGEGFASLGATGNLTYQINGLNVVPSFGIEFAPLMNPDLDKNFRPLLKGGLDIVHPRWEAGFEVNYDMALGELSKLETRGSVTVDIGPVSLEPFLALNVLPTLLENTWPRLGGHGLEVQWRTCCGTLNVGYRQFNEKFSTSFSILLEQPADIVLSE
jgi:hypothetical protein